MDKFLGWTLKQWGLAFASMNRQPESLKGALKIKRDYLIKHRMSPIEKLTIYNPEGDTRPCDWESTELLMRIAYKIEGKLSNG